MRRHRAGQSLFWILWFPWLPIDSRPRQVRVACGRVFELAKPAQC